MRDYLYALIGVALFGGIVRMLAPEGALQKYLRFSIALCLACAVLQPLLSDGWERGIFPWEEWSIGEPTEEINYDEIYNESLQNGAKAQAKELIRTKIYQSFSLTEEMASVEAEFLSKNGILELSEIRVILSGKGVLVDPREIVAFVNSEWGCTCSVIYE